MSLTFTPRPPLAPPSHLYQTASPLDSSSSPPLSPLNNSPPLSPTSQPVSPVAFPTDTAMRGTQAVPAPQLFPAHTKISHVPGDTPYNTPASPRRAPILAPRPSFGGMLTPGGGESGGIPSSLSTPLGDARPLNAALAMRSRGMSTIGNDARGGVGIPATKAAEVPYALTPGNTPSSMERISKRMASNLKIGNNTGGVEGVNRIMPSYDRRFTAGLQEVGNKLDEHVQSCLRSHQQTISPSMTRQAPSLIETDRDSSHSSERSQTGNFGGKK